MTGDLHYLMITPDRLAFGYVADQQGHQRVVVLMEYDSQDAPWLAPNVRLSLSMSPAEARQMAETLLNKANEAETS